MILFASDLDRTLIYSEKFLEKDDKQVQLVETKGSEKISYMLNSSIEMLKTLSSKMLFVPVTTRSIEQYRRIRVFKKEINPKYFIVCNGGSIFVNGKIDKEWNRLINSKLNNECLLMSEVILEFNKIKANTNIGAIREVDDLFFYCQSNDGFSEQTMGELTMWLEKNNWKMVTSGRKLYFTPKHVNKGEAVKYVADREGIKNIITSGDSLLDYDMAQISNLFISPQHGDIYNLSEVDRNTVKFTNESGMSASHEILEFVLKEIV